MHQPPRSSRQPDPTGDGVVVQQAAELGGEDTAGRGSGGRLER